MVQSRVRRVRHALSGILVALAGTSLVPSTWEHAADDVLPIVSLIAGVIWYVLDRDGDGTPDFLDRATPRDARIGQ